jgi:hypothetical protein
MNRAVEILWSDVTPELSPFGPRHAGSEAARFDPQTTLDAPLRLNGTTQPNRATWNQQRGRSTWIRCRAAVPDRLGTLY